MVWRLHLLDFRDLHYAWGEELEWVTSIGWDRVIRSRQPLGVLVGEGCRGTLKSLLGQDYEEFCVDTLEQALARCRQREQEYKQRLQDFRGRA